MAKIEFLHASVMFCGVKKKNFGKTQDKPILRLPSFLFSDHITLHLHRTIQFWPQHFSRLSIKQDLNPEKIERTENPRHQQVFNASINK